jgi:glutamate/tyrosine decarboxylase-like PLP-dependent enzyme
MRKDFAPSLETAMHCALEYLRNVDERPVGPTVSLETLRQRLCKEWNQNPLPAESVVRDLVKDIEGGLNNSVNARFYAWVVGGSLTSALAADWLTSTWDQNASLYSVSPASAIVEEAVGSWLKDLFRLPASSSFALVTGCQMAHTTCLAAARTWVLKKQGWDVERQGMSGSPQIRVLCGVRHATIDRTLHLLGFRDQSVTQLRVNGDGALDPSALEGELRRIGREPAIVLLQAGDVNTGGFDDFEALVPIARSYGGGRTLTVPSACGQQPVHGLSDSFVEWKQLIPGRPTVTNG